MSELMPSLTMIIVCTIVGIGTAYVFYSAIHREGARYWLLIPFCFGMLFFAGFDSGLGDVADQLAAFFIVALFAGLVSTPLDD